MSTNSILKHMTLSGISMAALAGGNVANAQSTAEEVPVQDIIVTGMRQAYIGDLPVKDIPQNVQSVDGAKLQGLGLTRLDSALDLVSGVSKLNNFGGLWDGYAIRGFAGDANNVPTGFLVNGFNARGFSGPRDTSSVERIDVLKGSTSALFGRGEPGGTVNIVTKKPEFNPKGRFQVQAGSWNNYRLDADYTTPLSDNLAVRINGAYENSDSFRDTIHSEKIFITPSILAKLGSSTTISYELEFGSLKVPFDRGIPIFNNDFSRLPASRFLGEPDDGPIRVDILGHQVQVQHEFSSNWSMLAGVSYRTTDFRGVGQVPELVASRQPFLRPGPTAGTLLSRQSRYHDFKSENLITRAELTGHFEIAGLANTLVVGADYDYFKLDQLQTRFRPPVYAGQSDAAMNAINVLDPVYGAFPPVNARASLVYDQLEKDYAWGTYFYDQIDLTSWLKIRAGGRYDEFRQHFLKRNTNALLTQKVTKFSPQAGVVIQPTSSVSLYGSFGKGFRPNNGASFAGGTFAPESSKSYEVGAKYISPDRGITASVALFSMTKTNILTADPANAGFVIAVGSAKSRGVEFDLSARLPFGLDLMVAYAYTDAFWQAEFNDPDFAKPILPGDPMVGIPKHSGNAMLTKDFEIADARKATIGAGVQYIDKRLGETATNYFLPSATLVKLIGSVELTDTITLSGNIDNLFNKRWFANSYSALWTFPGAPRSFSVRAQYKF